MAELIKCHKCGIVLTTDEVTYLEDTCTVCIDDVTNGDFDDVDDFDDYLGNGKWSDE